LWWDGRTCSLFGAYERKPSPARFMQVVRAGGHADPYLRVDVGSWYEDVRHGMPARVLRADRGFVRDDCTMSPDEAASQ